MRCVSLCCWWCCIPALVIGQIKTVVEDEYQNQFFAIISQVDRLGIFKNFITYADNKEQANEYGTSVSLQQRLMETFERPVIVAGTEIGLLRNIINDRNLAIIFFNGMHDSTLSTVDETLRSLKTIMTIFVYKLKRNLMPSLGHLEVFFTWCWNRQFYNIILLHKYKSTFEIWSYEMKREMKIYRLTNLTVSQEEQRAHYKFADMGQYRSVVAVYQNLPDTFFYKSKDGTVALGGHLGILLDEFMRHVNGTMDIMPLSFRNYTNAIAKGHKGGRIVDIGANLVTDLSFASYSPIVLATRTCLILPHNVFSIREFTLTYNGNNSLILFFVFYTIVQGVIKRIANPRLPFGVLVYRIFLLAMGQSMDSLFDDIPSALSERLVVVDKETRDKHVQALNDSYAYVMQSHKWLLMEFIQRRLLQPKLQLGPNKLCGVQRYLRFHLRLDLSYARVLKYFVTQIRETGLPRKLMQLGLRKAQETGIISEAPYEPPIRYPLPINFFEKGFILFACGISTSLAVFLLELVYYRWNHSRNSLRNINIRF
ncbi:uncharacterized protein [Drosophila virilis]|uniref:uncharacterized protein n=1 Tax=Drosophila virilis TaxID=7244 RepID=UPI0038B2542D